MFFLSAQAHRTVFKIHTEQPPPQQVVCTTRRTSERRHPQHLQQAAALRTRPTSPSGGDERRGPWRRGVEQRRGALRGALWRRGRQPASRPAFAKDAAQQRGSRDRSSVLMGATGLTHYASWSLPLVHIVHWQ